MPSFSGPMIAILMLLPSLNSCVNPWIYIYFNPNLVSSFCSLFTRRTSSNSNLHSIGGGAGGAGGGHGGAGGGAGTGAAGGKKLKRQRNNCGRKRRKRRWRKWRWWSRESQQRRCHHSRPPDADENADQRFGRVLQQRGQSINARQQLTSGPAFSCQGDAAVWKQWWWWRW